MEKEATSVSPSILRVLAFITDFILIGFFCRLGLVPLMLTQAWDIKPGKENFMDILPAYAIGLALFFFRDAWEGAGPGKRLLNIRVASVAEGFPASPANAHLMRSLWLFAFPVEIYRLLFNPHCRRLGDVYAGTVVVSGPKPEGFRFVTLRVIGIFCGAAFLWLSYIIATPWQLKKTAYYNLALHEVLLLGNFSQDLADDIELEEVRGEEESLVVKLSLEQSGRMQYFEVKLDRSGAGYKSSPARIVDEQPKGNG